MPGVPNSSGRLRFGVFELDLRAGELRKYGIRVRLQEQPFQVLVMLVTHPGEVVSREDLRNKLWPADTFVDFDHGLNKAVNKIRDALGDSAESPRFVETVARRGYRFLADVASPEGTLAAPSVEPQPVHSRVPSAWAWAIAASLWNWDAAEKEFLRAITLNPGYATAHQWYALQLSALGRSDEAVSEMKKAASLDPLSLIINADVADVLFAARRYDEAIEQSRRTIEMDPNFSIAHYELGQALVQKKVYGEAIGELQKASELSGGDTTCIAVLGYAYAASGKSAEALKLLKDLQSRTKPGFSYAPHQALIYASLSDKPNALSSLNKAYADHFDALILRSPGFDSLRSDPRFRELTHRVGLN